MRRKHRMFLFLVMLFALTLCSSLTYSMFSSNVAATSLDQNIAKFIFETESSDELQLPLVDLNPGDVEEYLFSVSNNYLGDLSEVAIEYQLIIKTYHLIPLIIELYSVVNEEETLILTCDETYLRNEENELVCESDIEQMSFYIEELDNYKIKVEFDSTYNDQSYADLVDYIDVEIKSWQKIGE